MLTLKLILLVVGILGLAFLAMGFNIFFRKKKFPEFEVGHNKDMRKLGIHCAKYEELKCHKKLKKGQTCGCH